MIGASAANDIAGLRKEGWNSVKMGRIVMAIVSCIVLICAIFNPPAIFVIMFLGGATSASSWMSVAFASVFSKRITKTGAFSEMLAGMLGCLATNFAKSFLGINLPFYLDLAIISIICNVVAIIIGSLLTKVSEEEKQARESLFYCAGGGEESERARECVKMDKSGVIVGLLMALLMLVFWIVPYLRAEHEDYETKNGGMLCYS